MDNPAPTNLVTERIRTAAKHLEQDSLRVQADLNANTVLFKILAEEREKENDFDAVAKLRQGLMEVLECAHRLECQSEALHNISQSFDAGAELADFKKILDEAVRETVAANPFVPAKDKLYQQFDQAIWNIHHAGQAAPGQEEEEIVMITQVGVRNKTCPLSGRPVIELENPVRSTECHHIYDQKALMDYIAQQGRKRCKCAIPGCPAELRKDKFSNDAALNIEIQELKLRERATQAAGYAEFDLEDEC